MEKTPPLPAVLVIHGPNLNLLGSREPSHYGKQDLDTLNLLLKEQSAKYQIELDCFQSNHEGALIDRIHLAAEQGVQFIIINPGGYTHTSVALRDALLAVSIPCIEVHLSNIFRREPFRHLSYFSDIAKGLICGLGPQGYHLALDAAILHIRQEKSK